MCSTKVSLGKCVMSLEKNLSNIREHNVPHAAKVPGSASTVGPSAPYAFSRSICTSAFVSLVTSSTGGNFCSSIKT